jgi:hypothetical protein
VATTLIDATRVEGDRVISVAAHRVPESTDAPEGIVYRFHYGTVDGETILRYDNAHGDHERHADGDVEVIAFPGVVPLYRRFEREIAQL